MAYQSKDLVRIAKRDHNPKRNYLVINRLQGKHIPVRPAEALSMFRALADKIPRSYTGKRTLVIGFAETATAIGAALAAALGAYYIQTTREDVPGAEYLYFSEEHSHAAQQRLVKNDLGRIWTDIDRVVFAEDEVTTGKTILHLIDRLEAEYPGRVTYAAASILNGMDARALRDWQARQIQVFYLVKTEQENYEKALSGYVKKGISLDVGCITTIKHEQVEYKADGRMDARRLVFSDDYEKACIHLREQAEAMAAGPYTGRILVLGTEEFMYPALLVADAMEKAGADVWFHATTRSPIAVYQEEQYPLHVRYQLPSLYDKNRRTFLYDIGGYEQVWIITDAPDTQREGMDALVRAVSLQNQDIYNQHIYIVRWC